MRPHLREAVGGLLLGTTDASSNKMTHQRTRRPDSTSPSTLPPTRRRPADRRLLPPLRTTEPEGSARPEPRRRACTRAEVLATGAATWTSPIETAMSSAAPPFCWWAHRASRCRTTAVPGGRSRPPSGTSEPGRGRRLQAGQQLRGSPRSREHPTARTRPAAGWVESGCDGTEDRTCRARWAFREGDARRAPATPLPLARRRRAPRGATCPSGIALDPERSAATAGRRVGSWP